MENDAGEHGSDWVRLELEICDDTEVAATAAYSPKEIVVLGGTGGYAAAVGKNDFRRKQVVEGEAMFAYEPTESTAKCQSRHAGNGDESTRGGEAMRLERVVDFSPIAAGLDPHRSRRRINRDRLHPRQVDHESVVTHGVAANVVTRATNRNQQRLLARKIDNFDYIRRVGALRNQRGPSIDHSVEHLARGIVLLVDGRQ